MARFLLVVAAGFGFLLTVALANLLVPILHGLHRGEGNPNIYQGISWCASKQGIPTMGGLCFILASVGAVALTRVGLAFGEPELMDVQWMNQMQLAVLTAFVFGAIGFLDDIIRAIRNQPAGLPTVVKFFLQMVATGGVLLFYIQQGYFNTTLFLPVVGCVALGDSYFVVAFVFTLFFVRCVEKTDGVDGLCTSCSFLSMLGLVILSVLFNSFEATIFPVAVASSLLAFLFWNFYPAKIAMGTTGSLFLAGAMVGIVQGLNWPGLLLLFGLPYFVEGTFSLVQFFYYLVKGKRALSAKPLHICLLEKGWTSVGLIYLFSGISLLGVVFAFLFVRVAM